MGPGAGTACRQPGAQRWQRPAEPVAGGHGVGRGRRRSSGRWGPARRRRVCKAGGREAGRASAAQEPRPARARARLREGQGRKGGDERCAEVPAGLEALSRGRVKELLARAGLNAMWSTADLEAHRQGPAVPGAGMRAQAPGAARACVHLAAVEQQPVPAPPTAPAAAPSLHAHTMKPCHSSAFSRDRLCGAVAAPCRQPHAAAEAAVDALLQQGQLERAADGALAAADLNA